MLCARRRPSSRERDSNDPLGGARLEGAARCRLTYIGSPLPLRTRDGPGLMTERQTDPDSGLGSCSHIALGGATPSLPLFSALLPCFLLLLPLSVRVSALIYLPGTSQLIVNCKTIGLGNWLIPLGWPISYIYNKGVQRYIVRIHIRTHIQELYSLTSTNHVQMSGHMRRKMRSVATRTDKKVLKTDMSDD